MKLILFLFLISLSMPPLIEQNEISEVFDKLHHVNGNDSAIDVTDPAESPKPLVKDNKPSLRKFRNAVKANSIDDWNSLAQFEKLIKLEMENLAAAKDHQMSNGTSPKPNGNNILKPEKHVRDFNSMRFF